MYLSTLVINIYLLTKYGKLSTKWGLFLAVSIYVSNFALSFRAERKKKQRYKQTTTKKTYYEKNFILSDAHLAMHPVGDTCAIHQRLPLID